MKILLTGGGTGGHFYPVIAVAEELKAIIKEQKLLNAEIFFMSDAPYNKGILFDNGIQFIKVPTGKYRMYFSLSNFFDFFKTIWGIFYGFIRVFNIYPDVIFGKGGYASFPALFAGKILGIPVIIHESDTVPGKVNLWASKFATKIAVSYPESEKFFPKDKVAWTGNPIRKEIILPSKEGAFDFLKLEKNIPVIFIYGGSQGSGIINETIISILPELLKLYQVIHQTGTKNFKDVTQTVSVVLGDNELKKRYLPYEYLDTINLRMAVGATDLMISRAGSTLFEIAAWGIPSIIIPITSSNGDHQRKNAFAYARTGAAVIVEENNLTPDILLAQINSLMEDSLKREKMKVSARSFAKFDAAKIIAEAIINIAISHE